MDSLKCEYYLKEAYAQLLNISELLEEIRRKCEPTLPLVQMQMQAYRQPQARRPCNASFNFLKIRAQSSQRKLWTYLQTLSVSYVDKWCLDQGPYCVLAHPLPLTIDSARKSCVAFKPDHVRKVSEENKYNHWLNSFTEFSFMFLYWYYFCFTLFSPLKHRSNISKGRKGDRF